MLTSDNNNCTTNCTTTNTNGEISVEIKESKSEGESLRNEGELLPDERTPLLLILSSRGREHTLSLCLCSGGCAQVILTVNIGVGTTYAALVSAIYAELARQRAEGNLPWQIIYFISSFINNFPMSVEFYIGIFEKIKQMFGGSKLSKISLFFGVGLGGYTTFAGLKVAFDGTSDVTFINRDVVLRWFSAGLFSFNVGTTRILAGSVLIDDCFKLLARQVYKRQTKYHALWLLLEDLEKHGDQVSVVVEKSGDFIDLQKRKASSGDYQQFVKQFYSALLEGRITPTDASRGKRLCKIAKISIILLLMYFVNYLNPMWFGLSAGGLKALGWNEENVANVTVAGVSQGLFYMYSCYKLIENLTQVGRVVVLKSSARARHYFHVDEKRYKPFSRPVLQVGGILFCFIVFGVLAYFSGSGYSEEMKRQQADHFGYVGGRYVDNWFINVVFYSLLANILPLVAMIFAGVVANGNGMLSFILRCVHRYSSEYDQLDTEAVEQKLKERLFHSDEAITEEFGSSLATQIITARKQWTGIESENKTDTSLTTTTAQYDPNLPASSRTANFGEDEEISSRCSPLSCNII